jgi:MerR family transcriptional regulator, copper efflux regulator
MTTERQAMYIGELAKRAGATPKAIRLYESLGLLGNVSRMGAYRVYTAQHVTQVRLIKQAQAMGFKLADVAPSMDGGKTEPNWAIMAEQVDQRRADIAQEIDRLRQLDAQLQAINIEIRGCAEMA